jgi:hypothetical protein
MNAKIRYLVLNRTNQVIRPRDENLPGLDAATLKAEGEIPKKFSPSFLNEDKAREFAAALATKYAGERFYVAMVVAGVTSQSLTWSEAEPVDGLLDENTAADLGTDADVNADDDADDNE